MPPHSDPATPELLVPTVVCALPIPDFVFLFPGMFGPVSPLSQSTQLLPIPSRVGVVCLLPFLSAVPPSMNLLYSEVLPSQPSIPLMKTLYSVVLFPIAFGSLPADQSIVVPGFPSPPAL